MDTTSTPGVLILTLAGSAGEYTYQFHIVILTNCHLYALAKVAVTGNTNSDL